MKRGSHSHTTIQRFPGTVAAVVEGFEAAETAGTLDEEGHSEPLKIMVVWWDGGIWGRSVFAHLEDGQGSIQLYFPNSVVGESSFEALAVLDVSDWIGVEGRMFRTRTGEVTIRVEGWTLLTNRYVLCRLGRWKPMPRQENGGFTEGFRIKRVGIDTALCRPSSAS